MRFARGQNIYNLNKPRGSVRLTTKYPFRGKDGLMKYYIKQGLFPFIYLLFMAMIALGILCIQGLIWLKIVLCVANVALYGVIVFAAAFQDGQKAMKVQVANDLERREIIRTGEDRPLKLHEEYKPWKGFVFGFVACVPLIALLIVHVIVHFAGGGNVVGGIAGIVYFMFFAFFRLDATAATEEAAVISWYAYFGTLIALPVIMIVTGVAYILGAKKIQRQQNMIKEKQRQIYGE